MSSKKNKNKKICAIVDEVPYREGTVHSFLHRPRPPAPRWCSYLTFTRRPGMFLKSRNDTRSGCSRKIMASRFPVQAAIGASRPTWEKKCGLDLEWDLAGGWARGGYWMLVFFFGRPVLSSPSAALSLVWSHNEVNPCANNASSPRRRASQTAVSWNSKTLWIQLLK